jgi:predicted alpha/beta-fold hydrolase
MMKHVKSKDIKAELQRRPFTPPVLLSSPLAQAAAHFVTPYFTLQHIPKIRKLIQVAEGSQIIVDCYLQKDSQAKPTVVILNGFEGYEKKDITHFSKGILYKAYYYGYNAVILRQRGEGEGITLTKSPGDFVGEDVEIALQEISSWGMGKLYLVGYSLGSWAAFKAVGHMSDLSQIAGIVGVAVPVNTEQVWEYIEKNTLFDRMLLSKYKSLIARRMAIDPPGTWDKKILHNVKTKRQFFETYKQFFGYPQKFTTLDEYFSLVEISNVLARIALPTLIIHAHDDPALPVRPFLQPEIQNNPSIITLLPKHGSHGYFIGRNKPEGDVDRHWAQNRALEFINLLTKKENH